MAEDRAELETKLANLLSTATTISGRINTIEQAVAIGKKLYRSWFRGHSTVVGKLIPRIYRDQYEGNVERAEPRIATYFLRHAPVLSERVPTVNDHLGWLLLMQHHGAPTRLLDWTENILAALYFAVTEHPDQDGEVWAMYSRSLNEFSLSHPDSRIDWSPDQWAVRLADEAFQPETYPTQPKGPLALYPPCNSQRMASQWSVFTIHPRPASGARTIVEALGDNHKALCRYIVPVARKRQLGRHLAQLGITARALFQDLDSLARSAVEENKFFEYVPPEPPRFP